MPTIRQYKDTTDRIQVVELWRNVFGYDTAHNEPNLAVSKKTAALFERFLNDLAWVSEASKCCGIAVHSFKRELLQ